jgi:hypothetical protein
MASRNSRSTQARKANLAKKKNRRQDPQPPKSSNFQALNDSLSIRPRVGHGELDEDAAIFNKDYLLKLPAERRVEATMVMEALELTSRGKFLESMEKLKDISRNSAFADWRLFVRGLHAFYSSDVEATHQNWSRLDRTRRPARIASALLAAEHEKPGEGEALLCSPQMVEHARKLRLRKEAVSAAEAIAKTRHRDPKVTFAVSQVAMLGDFIAQFRRVDSDFVQTFGQACVVLSTFQGDMLVFDRLTKLVSGPISDPNWNKTRFNYALAFQGGEKTAIKSLEAFLNQDVPKLTHLPEQVRKAIGCLLYLVMAENKRSQQESPRALFPFFSMNLDVDYKAINDLLRKAIAQYPTHRLAHAKLIDSLERQISQRGTTKVEEERLEKQILAAREALIKAIPEDTETALWLIDYYLEEDEFKKAKALIQNLEGKRIEDPAVKALPWKLKLRESMILSNRKTDLRLAANSLEEAESVWPTWLSRNWLPFLQGALALRIGDKEKFERLTTQARQDQKCSEVVGDIMTFAALQQMNIPSLELKPYRTLIEQYLQKANALELNDLFALGSFFWDLARTGMKHKGYRMQASKLGKAFSAKAKFFKSEKLNPIEIDAFSWAAHHHLWLANSTDEPPNYLLNLALKEPRLALAAIHWIITGNYSRWRIRDHQPLIQIVKEAARLEKDPFYRYLYDKVTAEAEAIIAKDKAEREMYSAFGSSSIESDEDEDDDEYEDEDDDEYDSLEDECDCDSCRAKRARRAKTNANFLDDEDDDDYDEEEDDFDLESSTTSEFQEGVLELDLPPFVEEIVTKLGPKGLSAFERLCAEQSVTKDAGAFMNATIDFLRGYGINRSDAIQFVADFGKYNLRNPNRQEQSAIPDVVKSKSTAGMTAAEIKAARKQREKELERKKRKARQGSSRS